MMSICLTIVIVKLLSDRHEFVFVAIMLLVVGGLLESLFVLTVIESVFK